MALDAAYFSKTYPWSDIRTETVDGQAMVWIPKFYYRVHTPTTGPYTGKKCWEVADSAADGFVVHPAFMKAGLEISGFYVGAYEASADGTTKAASVAGVTPFFGELDFATMQNRCAARNVNGQTGWHMWNVYELAAVQMLCFLEIGSPDVQTKVGAGNCGGGSIAITGSTNAKWRGISELWGNSSHMIDGLKGNGKIIQIFDRLGNGTYVNTGITACTTPYYVVDMFDTAGTGFDFKDVFMPKSTDATQSNGSFGDYYWNPQDNFVLWHGGSINDSSNAGLFATRGTAATNGGGGRLAKN